MTRPELRLGSHLLPGLIAVGLFAVMAWIFLNASFGQPATLEGGSVIESIGFSLLNIPDVEGTFPAEGFLAAFILIALALDAALDGSIMLARRDNEEESLVTGLRTDGGDDKGGDDR